MEEKWAEKTFGFSCGRDDIIVSDSAWTVTFLTDIV
jgi:hypothetical protein